MPKMIVYKTNHKEPGLKFPHPDQIGSPCANCAEFFNVKGSTSQNGKSPKETQADDIPKRTRVLASADKHHQLTKNWNAFNQKDAPFYAQGLMIGEHFLTTAYSQAKTFQKMMQYPSAPPEVMSTLSFAFLDDHGKTCGFSIVFDPNKPSEWAASVYRDADKLNLEDREAYFITHEGNKEAKELFEKLESQPTEIDNLKELIKCEEINSLLGNLINEKNQINFTAATRIETLIDIGLNENKTETKFDLYLKYKVLFQILPEFENSLETEQEKKFFSKYQLEIFNAILDYRENKREKKLKKEINKAGENFLTKIKNAPGATDEAVKKASGFLERIKSFFDKFFYSSKEQTKPTAGIGVKEAHTNRFGLFDPKTLKRETSHRIAESIMLTM